MQQGRGRQEGVASYNYCCLLRGVGISLVARPAALSQIQPEDIAIVMQRMPCAADGGRAQGQNKPGTRTWEYIHTQCITHEGRGARSGRLSPPSSPFTSLAVHVCPTRLKRPRIIRLICCLFIVYGTRRLYGLTRTNDRWKKDSFCDA